MVDAFRQGEGIPQMTALLLILAIITPAHAWEPPARARSYMPAIEAAREAHNLPDGLLARLLHEESRYRRDVIAGHTISPRGAVGIAQFMPETANDLGVDPRNPKCSIYAAAEYLAWLKEHTGSWRDALAAYNWGIGRVWLHGRESAPRETRRFVRRIARDVDL